MSFGISVGDFIALADKAHRLYVDVYKVARAAPQQLKGLDKELASLSQSISLIVDELKDPDSLINRAGPVRAQMVNELKDHTNETLTSLEAFARKHELVKSPSHKSSKLKQGWDKLLFAKDARSIDSLRSKIVYHYSVMQLLLTSVGNSSLERMQSEQTKMANTIEQIKTLMLMPAGAADHTSKNMNPSISAVEAHDIRIPLTERLMAFAEEVGPWTVTGLDFWIQTGRWWLVKAQRKLSGLPRGGVVHPQEFMNLLKASWILVDIISVHPQRDFISGGWQQKEVGELSLMVQPEFNHLKNLIAQIPSAEAVLAADPTIWESSTGTIVKPGQTQVFKYSRGQILPIVSSVVLFQCFGSIQLSGSLFVPCMIFFSLDQANQDARLRCQSPSGSTLLDIVFIEQPCSISIQDQGREGENHIFAWQNWQHGFFSLDNVLSARLLVDNNDNAIHLAQTLIGLLFTFELFDLRLIRSASTIVRISRILFILWQICVLRDCDARYLLVCDLHAPEIQEAIKGVQRLSRQGSFGVSPAVGLAGETRDSTFPPQEHFGTNVDTNLEYLERICMMLSASNMKHVHLTFERYQSRLPHVLSNFLRVCFEAFPDGHTGLLAALCLRNFSHEILPGRPAINSNCASVVSKTREKWREGWPLSYPTPWARRPENVTDRQRKKRGKRGGWGELYMQGNGLTMNNNTMFSSNTGRIGNTMFSSNNQMFDSNAIPGSYNLFKH